MKRSGHVRCRSRGALVAALCAALACIPDVAGAQDDREGFYAGLHLGVALRTVVTSARRYVSHPTRYDVLLYPPSVSPPADDPACSNNTPGTTANTFTLGAGPTAERKRCRRWRPDDGTLRDTMAGATSTYRATGEPSVRDLAHGLRSR